MPLHLDYRPDTLDEFIGNEELKATLGAILESSDRPRVFLFAGPRGCGKSTLAGIIAKAVNCSSFDFRKINLSSDRGIDVARELEFNALHYPMSGSFKVYLLEEAHGGTPAFYECMLDILEHTPPHTIFVLCTTQPEKLKDTVHDRCTRFDVRPLRASEIRLLLKRVLEKEGVSTFPDTAITKISQSCQGSPRKALVLLNKVIDIADDDLVLKVLEEDVIEEVTTQELVEILLRKGTPKEVAKVLTILQDKNPETIRRAVLGYCNKKFLATGSIRAAIVMEAFSSPFYETGPAGLSIACCQCVVGEINENQ